METAKHTGLADTGQLAKFLEENSGHEQLGRRTVLR